jgi:hypothetical protein
MVDGESSVAIRSFEDVDDGQRGNLIHILDLVCSCCVN